MEECHRLYPQLSEGGETFRLQTVSKYFSFTGTLSVILSASGTGAALTGVDLPVGASLASIVALCGILSVSTGSSLKQVIRKVNKHEQIITLCRNTISSINTSVSRALSDNVISHEEFVEVKSKVEKYEKQKDDIRN